MPRTKPIEPKTAEQPSFMNLPANEPVGVERESPTGALLTKSEFQKMSLWQAIERMTQDDWADKVMYIYRTAPHTINKTSREKYGALDKGDFYKASQEDFQERFGGGRFHFILNRGRETWGEARVTWPGAPRLLVDEELKVPSLVQPEAKGSDGENTARVVKLFLEDQKARREEAGDESGAEALDRAIELMSKGADKAIEIAGSGKGNGGSLIEMTTALKTMHEIAAPRDSLTSKDLMDFGLKIASMFKPAAGAPEAAHPVRNPMAEMKDMMVLMRELKAEAGVQDMQPAQADFKVVALQALMEGIKNLPAILQENRLAQMQQIQMLVGQNRGGPAPQGPQFPPANQPPQYAAQPQPQAGAADAFDSIKRNVVRMFKEGDGGDFVARMIQVINPTLYSALSISPEADILKFINDDAILREIAGAEELPQFVKEMLEFFAEEKKPQPEPEPALVQ